MKNFNIMGVHWKIWFLGGGGELPVKVELGQFADLREAFKKKRGVVFLRVGWYPNTHYV